MRRLIVVLAEEGPTSSERQDTLLFNRLLELEMNAEKEGAAEASCRVIGRVRQIAGTAVARDFPAVIRGH